MPNEITFGQMRTQLNSVGARWTIGANALDAASPPLHGLGAKLDGLIEAQKAPAIDLSKILNITPGNPFLAARRAANKFITQDQVTRSLPNFASPDLPPSGGGGAPSVVDWRHRGSWPWLCTVQSQVGENCWAMAATALVESMVRISHGVWSKRSEGDVHDGMGAKINDTGSAQAALDWIKANGICDWDDYPTQATLPYKPAPDRNGRTVKIEGYTVLGDINQQKQWLDANGPLITWFDVWHDFDYYYHTSPTAVYHWQEYLSPGVKNFERGGHFMLVVGYDDNLKAWICRNSWGTDFGNGGYCLVAYGDQKSGIDAYARIGLTVTNPDPWTKRRLHNGAMIESGDGAQHRNFELAVRSPTNNLVHYWRDGTSLAWNKAETFANDVLLTPSLTGTTFNRNFEMVYASKNGRLHHWFYDQAAHAWKDGGIFGPPDAAGQPAFLQSDFGEPGNFEVVVRSEGGQLVHWWRNDGPPWTWKESARFGADIAFSSPSLVQSHIAAPGNLELIAVRKDGKMQRFYRDDVHKTGWHAAETFGAAIASPPIMIEGQYGATDENTQGNFELCVAAGGKVQHWWRNNNGGGAWAQSATFGHDVRNVIALLEGSFGFDLEVVVERNDGKVQHYWRDGGGWHEGVVIA